MQSIIVKHNVEMAHRLYMQPNSKCYNLHGHSWWVEAEIFGEPDNNGMIIDFAIVKKEFRVYLDSNFDHHCCLNDLDPLAFGNTAPGVVTVECDPTVENMARIWGEWLQQSFGDKYSYKVKVWEASTNAATWSSNVSS
jgi:6-pyruvoyl tetrahydropterin synthase/QueD family protein